MRYYFFVQELVEGKVGINYVKSEGQLANVLGTKHHRKHRHRDLMGFINDVQAGNANKLINYQGKAIIFVRE